MITINPINFTGLIPLKDYKGPILKLTKSEMAKIADLQENINQLELDLYNIDSKYSEKKLLTQQLHYYSNKKLTIIGQINELKEIIKHIKLNRLNKQKTN